MPRRAAPQRRYTLPNALHRTYLDLFHQLQQLCQDELKGVRGQFDDRLAALEREKMQLEDEHQVCRTWPGCTRVTC